MQKDYYYKMNEDEANDNRWFKARKDIIIWLIKKIFKHKKDINILDVWSWTWYFLEKLIQYWYAHVKWFDFSEDAISICKQKWIHIEYWFLPNINIDNRYDCITCLDVIEHIDDDKKSMENILKVLKDNGKAIFTVPAYKFLWWYHDEINHHKRRYTLKWFKYLVEHNWWQIEYISYYNFFLFPIALLFKYINKRSSNMSSKPNNFVNKIFYKIFKSEFWFIKKWFKFPFWVSIVAVVSKK